MIAELKKLEREIRKAIRNGRFGNGSIVDGDAAERWADRLAAIRSEGVTEGDSAVWVDSRVLDRLKATGAVQANLYSYRPQRRYDRVHVRLYPAALTDKGEKA